MSTSPISTSASGSTPLTTPEQPSPLPAPAAASAPLPLHLDLGFPRLTVDRLGISVPAPGSNTGVLIAEVLAENEKLRLANEQLKGSNILSRRIRDAIDEGQGSAANLARLEEETRQLEAELETLYGQRDILQTDRADKLNTRGVFDAQIAALQSEIDAQAAAIARIESMLAELDANVDASAADALQAEIDALTAELAVMQAEYASLPETAAAADATHSLDALIDSVDASLASLEAELGALGGDGDPAVRAEREAQRNLLAALKSALAEQLDALVPDPGAGAAQTLDALAAAAGKAAEELADRLETVEGDEGLRRVLDLQIGVLKDLAGTAAARLETLTAPPDEGDGGELAPPDPGAREGLRIASGLIFGAASRALGATALATAPLAYSARNTLQASIDELNRAISALEDEKAEVEPEDAPELAAFYDDDIAALQQAVSLLEAKRDALPGGAGPSGTGAIQAEIDALTEAMDAVDDAFFGSDGQALFSERARDTIRAATDPVSDSIDQLNIDLGNADDEQLIAEREATLRGYASSANALAGLLAPLESRYVALGDEGTEVAKAQLQLRIDTLQATIAGLQSELDTMDPEDSESAQLLLETQRDAAAGARDAATAARNDLIAQKALLDAEISALDTQIAIPDNSINEKNAALATKAAEYSQIVDGMTGTSTDKDTANNRLLGNLLSSLFDELILEGILDQMDENERSANRPARWRATAEERATQLQEKGSPLRTPVYGQLGAADVGRTDDRQAEKQARELALYVGAAVQGLATLAEDAPPPTDYRIPAANGRVRLDL